jgi:hypothetical protein
MALSFLFGLLVLAQAPAAAGLSAPERFFLGRTEGVGVAQIIFSGRRQVRVRSQGRLAADGALLIDQVVHEEGKPPRRRHWRLVRGGGHSFTGSVTDARGAVAGEIRGNVLHIRYRSADNVSIDQRITIQPGGRTARNQMTFHRFGLRVATLDETIRRLE